MNDKLKEQLESAIAANAEKSAKSGITSLEALQYSQAAVNVSNALIGLSCESRQNPLPRSTP